MDIIVLFFIAPLVASLAGMVSGILFAVNSSNRLTHGARSLLPLVSSVAPLGVMALAAFLPADHGPKPVGGAGIWLLAMAVVPLAFAIWSAKVLTFNFTQILFHVVGPPVSGLLLAVGCIYLAAIAVAL